MNIVPADGLAPNGARPSAGTMITIKLYMFTSTFLCLLMILRPFHGSDSISKKDVEIQRVFTGY